MLRTHKLGEADRIITLLTRQHGRVRAVAKGVRRTTSRWGSRLEPFTHVDLQLAEGRNLDVITQAETIDAVPGARSATDYDRYTAGTVMLETADRLVAEEKQPAVQQFLLLVGGLRAMTAGERGARAGARLLPAPLARGGRLRAVVRPLRQLRRARGPAPVVLARRPAACCAPTAGSPARPPRPPAPRRCSARCWPATGRPSTPPTPPPARGVGSGRGVPALAPRARAAVAGVRRAMTPSSGPRGRAGAWARGERAHDELRGRDCRVEPGTP